MKRVLGIVLAMLFLSVGMYILSTIAGWEPVFIAVGAATIIVLLVFLCVWLIKS